jgi:hypothetical protein
VIGNFALAGLLFVSALLLHASGLMALTRWLRRAADQTSSKKGLIQLLLGVTGVMFLHMLSAAIMAAGHLVLGTAVTMAEAVVISLSLEGGILAPATGESAERWLVSVQSFLWLATLLMSLAFIFKLEAIHERSRGG